MLHFNWSTPPTMRTHQVSQRARTRTAVFANSKGGVGKSTLALLTCLGLATRDALARIELIDIDVQSTSSESLKKFTNERFSVINDDGMFLASGGHWNNRLKAKRYRVVALTSASLSEVGTKITSHFRKKLHFSGSFPAGLSKTRKEFWFLSRGRESI
jgi:hypothetical protein